LTVADVLLLAQFFPPETNAAANRIGPIAAALAGRERLRVVTLEPSYPSPERYDAAKTADHDRAQPYPVRRAFAFRPHTRSLPLRAAREQVMAIRLALRALRGPADIVVVSTPSMFLAPVAWFVARVKRALFVWDVRDVTWRLAGELAGARGPAAVALRLVERIMWAVLARADLVVSATPGITDFLAAHGVALERIHTHVNTISTELRDALHADGAAPRAGRPTVAYAGLMGYSQGLDVLLPVARDLPDVDFVLAGDGPQRAGAERRAAELGLDNVAFTGYLGREGLVDLYRRSDVLFVQTEDTAYTNAVVIPMKLHEYMAAGRPIVYAGRGLAVDFLEGVGCAAIVPPRDPAAIAAAIRELTRDPERARLLGERGREYVDRSETREELAERLVDAIEALLRERKGQR
jgi:putative colanic acid biosynthesis glycosyltransferase WcaI